MAEVKLLGLWASPFSNRVEIALKMKGVEYEFIPEDILNKSEQILEYNPIHKKVPVLLHNGKPLAESQVILEYIDETWKGDHDEPLLPRDPYERGQARFWARFIDDKLTTTLGKALFKQGEVSENAMEEGHELLKVFESSIKHIKGQNKFLGANNIGLLDIVTITIIYELEALQEAAGKELLKRQEFPQIYTWVDEVLESDVIRKSMPDKDKLVAFFLVLLEAKLY